MAERLDCREASVKIILLDYLTNFGTSTVTVLLGTGTGTFPTAVDYFVGNNPRGVITGDFNGDAKTDLAVTNGGYARDQVSVLLGTGTGTFQAAVDYAVGSTPEGMFAGDLTAGDFNMDGKTDLAVTNFGSNTVSVLLGTGTGTFQTAVNYAAGSTPFGIVAGDFNVDGKTDLVVTNLGSNTVSVLLGTGTGTFQTAVSYAVGSRPRSVVTGDFDRDGKTDLAVANEGYPVLSVLLGTGTGTFQTAVNEVAGISFFAITAGDFNRDGKTDLAMTETIPTIRDVVVLLNQSS